jgi:hypothetical protein
MVSSPKYVECNDVFSSESELGKPGVRSVIEVAF